jgi:hypothetical protein
MWQSPITSLVAGLVLLATSGVTSATEVYWTPAHELAPAGDLSGCGGCDLDGDGDYDLTVLYGELEPSRQYWNAGTPQLPSWQLDVTQFAGIFLCSLTGKPAGFGDLDADGDLDLVFGCFYGDLHMHWNVGTPQTPAWQQDPSVFQGLAAPWKPACRLADLDADGDLDLIVACNHPAAYVRYFENTGTPASPQWTYRGPLSGVTFPSSSHVYVALGDLDGDGDLDMIGSCESPLLQCWENVGTPQSFQFIENPSMLLGIGPFSQPVGVGLDLADFDGDGDPDLLVARLSGNYLYLNERVSPVDPTSWSIIKAMYR